MGRETTLDGRALFAHAKTASYLYQASLRREASLQQQLNDVRAELLRARASLTRHNSAAA